MSNKANLNDKSTPFWTSKANLFWVVLAVLLVLLHLLVHHSFSEFNPPATPNKPPWIRGALYGELGVHILFLGAVITGIRNRVSGLKQPSYGDEGTLSIDSSEPPAEAGVRWGEIGVILIEFTCYLAIWGWIYGII